MQATMQATGMQADPPFSVDLNAAAETTSMATDPVGPQQDDSRHPASSFGDVGDDSHEALKTGTKNHRGGVLLTDPDDGKWLSGLPCYLRLQIEYFTATQEDIDARTRKGGMKEPIALGRVGIRCVHCAHLPPKERTNGAVTYPKSIRLVHQAVRNWQRYHLNSCPFITDAMRDKIKGFGRKHSGNSSLRHWIQSCELKGLADAEGGVGIVVVEGSPLLADEAGDTSADAAADTGISHGASERRSTVHSDDSSSSSEDAAASEGSASHVEAKYPEVARAKKRGAGIDETPGAAESKAAPDCIVSGITIDAGNFAGGLQSASGGGDEKGTDSEQLSLEPLSLDLDGIDLLEIGEEVEELLEEKDEANNDAQIGDAVSNLLQTSPDALLSRDKMSPCNGAGAIASSSAPSLTAKNNAAREEKFERILEKTRLAYDIVRTTREMRLVPEQVSGAVSSTATLRIETDSRDDLFSLGLELYELFAGCRPFGETESETMKTDDVGSSYAGGNGARKKRERRGPDEGGYTPLSELGFPISLSDLVSSLLNINKDKGGTDSNSTGSYVSTFEVEEDLRRMTLNPDRSLFDPDIDALSGELDFTSNKLYGREAEALKLMDSYRRVIDDDGACEMVMVGGYSGTGKSTLVKRVCKPLMERRGFFISGKFDELRQVQPLSAIVAAFNGFCDTLLAGDADSLDDTKTAIRAAVGSDGKVLTDLIPNMKKVIGESDDSIVEVGGKEAQNRLVFFFRKFLRAITSPVHPVILFLDDLQWADEASLDFVRMLVTDRGMSSLLFLGCYRDNEVGDDHPLKTQLGQICSSGVNITSININNMGRDNVNDLISDTLHLPPRQTQALADLVYNKTSGNVLFVVEFLKSLFDEGFLHFSFTSRRWKWDVEAIQSKNISDNVVELMTSKMRKLAPKVLRGLNMAACLGWQCDESTLKLLDSSGCTDQQGILHHLEVALREGLMCKVGSTYKFTHDQIQSAAYLLIPCNEVEAMHLHIGRLLSTRVSAEELDRILFVVVDQLQRGSKLITDQDEKNELANLCLMAGKKAISTSAFQTASVYLLQGIDLLDTKHWEERYDLSLELFSCCAEVQCVLGNINEISIITGPVFQHGRSLQDKLRTYYALINALGNQEKQADALKHGLDVLRQLGESFPSDPNQSDIVKDFAKTREMSERSTIDGILHKNEMEDKDKLSVMKFLNLLNTFAFHINQQLSPLISFRMVQLSLSHGLSKESSFAFGTFGVACIQFGDTEKGYQYGKLALSLLERLKAKEYLARVYSVVYGFINIFTQPIQAVFPSHKHAYDVAMATGHTEWASDNGSMYILAAFQCGVKLETLLPDAITFCEQMKEYGNQSVASMTLPYLQATMNLLGSPEDPTLLTGDAMNEEELMRSAEEKQHGNGPGVMGTIYYVRMSLAYIFRRYDLAAEMAERRIDVCKKRDYRLGTIVNETFYTGLIAMAVSMLQGSEQSEWKTRAYDAREKMKAWAGHSSWNCQHKFDLLDAEIAHFIGDADRAARAYDDAIRAAGLHGFVHEQAIACERAGIFYSKECSPVMALDYFKRAHRYYLEWGAKCKADDLSRRLAI